MFGVNPWKLMAWMGHKSITTTMKYVHLAGDHMRPLPDAVLAAAREEADPGYSFRVSWIRNDLASGFNVDDSNLSRQTTDCQASASGPDGIRVSILHFPDRRARLD